MDKMIKNKIKVEDLFKCKNREYKIFSEEMKKKFCTLAQLIGIKNVENLFEINSKNLLRWNKNGCKRKIGSGRRAIVKEISSELIRWYTKNKEKNINITNIMIKQKVTEINKSNCNYSKSSIMKIKRMLNDNYTKSQASTKLEDSNQSINI